MVSAYVLLEFFSCKQTKTHVHGFSHLFLTLAPNQNRPFYRHMYDDLQFRVPETGRKHLMWDPASPGFNSVTKDNLIHGTVDQHIAELEQNFFTTHMQQYFGMVKCIDFNVVRVITCNQGYSCSLVLSQDSH